MRNWSKLMRLRLLKSGDEYWLLVQADPIISDEMRRSFARMSEGRRLAILFQEQRRRAAARKRLGAAGVMTSTRRR